ncbi:hypothetical protein BU23DRAFT_561240 [Bimuria novae-zelandiae CBS 107.79]|uniref:Uncharacterized protein n=1 Tax=Bimuria novae-zelandiae CBS 107.79 TaxID=1447943 RepID=A0A6A5ULI3_9PLEO|nr:hypothetical protein BU23DRAFT_561240 [Bimuria novae-zelandiae CBS 107.79]
MAVCLSFERLTARLSNWALSWALRLIVARLSFHWSRMPNLVPHLTIAYTVNTPNQAYAFTCSSICLVLLTSGVSEPLRK